MDGVLALRPFLPARDYPLSRSFYKQLGFEAGLETDELTIFEAGDFSFILQNFYVKELADNFMVQLTVRGLRAWWRERDLDKLARDCGARPPRSPALQPWGLEVGFLFDPSGVLWHVTQSPE